ncbi:sulfite exporter TauE/SafE family protein [Histidinibacterium aquaticum]|uniref:Probable membrane transporter protein n=1 Tax=Histidinibacterium aquaticum TaxID=2613962 RepID=A0A5J5GM51_9RHOB|nr:sulfite exporter TauE/SafE family protein [Histidinibacterium aquaticum]KAA9009240.1 sulfite exporter TauE/SafE family protein [Histidinibacterium aquaticum]
MDTPEFFWLAAIAAAFFVGGSKGGLPMIALLSVPTMSLVMPPMQGAALLLPVYLVSDVYGIWIYRHAYSKRNLAILIPAGALGVLAGYLLAGQIDEDAVRIVIGVVGLTFLAMRMWTRFSGTSKPKPADVPRGIFWGTISGFTSFVSHAGGPAFQLYALPQQLPKLTFAGTSTILFAAINLIKVPPYLALGLMEVRDLQTVALLSPVAILGAWVGYRITRILPERVFFLIVELALFAISVNLIRAGVMGL